MARTAPPTRTRAKSRRTSRRRPTRGRRGTARRRRERARRWRIAIIAVFTVVSLAALGVVVAVVIGVFTSLQALPRTLALPSPPAPITAPAPPAYDQEQRDNAAIIMTAGIDMGLSVRDQAIGIMTAMGESSLRNIDYGDWETSGVTNPDGERTTSIGLFQQQDSWGTRDERLDPYTAATLFYRAMVDRVPDRDSIAPTLVAHNTQINEDPNHYARYWPRAVALIESLTGVESGLTE